MRNKPTNVSSGAARPLGDAVPPVFFIGILENVIQRLTQFK